VYVVIAGARTELPTSVSVDLLASLLTHGYARISLSADELAIVDNACAAPHPRTVLLRTRARSATHAVHSSRRRLQVQCGARVFRLGR
jgi:hypothetical protein